MQNEQRWIRDALGLLDMSAGALALGPAPTRRALLAFATLANGLADRAPAFLAPWPALALALNADEDGPVGALALERRGSVLTLAETPPGADGLAPRDVLEYYLHLVHDHWRAHRVAARQPVGLATRLPADEARLAALFDDVAGVLAGSADRERLAGLWDALQEA
jgi:hypothetical protein